MAGGEALTSLFSAPGCGKRPTRVPEKSPPWNNPSITAGPSWTTCNLPPDAFQGAADLDRFQRRDMEDYWLEVDIPVGYGLEAPAR
ncbi:MAG: hypothetical protein R2751_14125 [Bacteroidales bacterium]